MTLDEAREQLDTAIEGNGHQVTGTRNYQKVVAEMFGSEPGNADESSGAETLKLLREANESYKQINAKLLEQISTQAETIKIWRRNCDSAMNIYRIWKERYEALAAAVGLK